MKKLTLLLLLLSSSALGQSFGSSHGGACIAPLVSGAAVGAVSSSKMSLGIQSSAASGPCSSIYSVFRGATQIGSTSNTVLNVTEGSLSANTLYSYDLYQGTTLIGTYNTTTLATAPVLFQETFEQESATAGADIGWWAKDHQSSTTVVATNKLVGSKAVYVNSLFSAWVDTGLGHHNMINQSPSSQVNRATLGTDIWLGFSTYLDNWSPDFPSNGELFQQWHGASGTTTGLGPGGCSSPPVAIYTHGTELEFATNYSNTNDTNNIHSHYLWTDLLANYVGVRTDWVMKLNFNYLTGTVDVWRNGEHVVAYVGPNIYHCVGETTTLGPHTNFGVYKWDWGNTPTQVSVRSIYIDEIRIGNATATCADVKPTGAAACQ